MESDKSLFEMLKEGASLAECKQAIDEVEDLHQMDEDGYNLLHLAIEHNNKEVASYLIQKGCDINNANDKGVTLLEHAIQLGELEIVDMLLKEGVHFFDRDGFKPLHAAAVSSSVEMLEKIMTLSSEVNIIDNGGYTPLHWACQEGSLEVVKILVDKGALINVLDESGMTPLRVAAAEGHVGIFDYLIQHGAVTGDFSFHTLFHIVASWNKMEIGRRMLHLGAKVNAMDEYGNTPLHFAHMHGHADMEMLLLDHGADITIKNKYGMLPLEIELEKFDELNEADED